MSRRHYQIIILGNSLAARLAGALLAKSGVRVLSCAGDSAQDDGWFHSSALLEKILEDLAGRSIYSAPIPFQVITGTSRLDFQGDSPLEEELRREFPATHLQVAAVLRRLAATGERIETLLWEKTGLPLFGLRSRLAFGWHRLRQGLGQDLGQPLTSLFADLRNDSAWPALNELFAGLALVPAERLSVAEGALLWSACARPRSVSATGLNTLLRQRFVQFHGEEAELGAVSAVDVSDRKTLKIRLGNGVEHSSDHLLLGSTEAFSLLPEEVRSRFWPPPRPAVFTAEIPESVVSPLLAPRVILEGSPPLRLGLAAREGQIGCTVEICRTDGGSPPEPATVHGRLLPLLPFADFELRLQEAGVAAQTSRRKTAFPGAAGPLRFGQGLLLCHGARAFPSLGATGEIAVGFSVARHLLRRLAPRS